MKVLILATDIFFKGGIQRYTRYQYKALRELYGDENVFIFSLSPEEKENSFEEEIGNIAYIGNGLGTKSKINYTYEVLKFIKNNKIGLIISTHTQLSIIAYLAKKLFNVRYFTNVYGLEIWSGLTYKDKIGLLNSDKLIGDCKFILKYIKKEFNYAQDKQSLLYDPVDINKFKPLPKNLKLMDKYNIPKEKFIISTIGRLERNKGHKIIIESLPKIDENIIYVIVGGGFMREKLETLVNKLHLNDRVIFTGRVPEDELVDFYNIADIVALLSVFGDKEGEGLPLGLIEAMGCEKPIIAGNQDGSAEAVSDKNPNGFVIDPTSEDQFVEKINILYRDKNLQKIFAHNGLENIKNDFSFSKFKYTFEQIINKG